jgi:hypothetical protein
MGSSGKATPNLLFEGPRAIYACRPVPGCTLHQRLTSNTRSRDSMHVTHLTSVSIADINFLGRIK